MLTERHIEKLTSINSIEKLLDFLRVELDWPLAEGDVNELTFSYDADELGIKPEHAPKINKVYQIRPISGDQPWGVFFIDFENKKLPVTLMRRILNHLRIKNRGKSGQWEAGDLLFMTTYGEEVEGMREVAFAHFHQQAGDLPTLNVLQWDAQDTPLKLKTTYEALRSNLGWPPDTEDKDAWRTQWRTPFKRPVGHVIRTSKGLAEKLAELSRNIRDSVREVLEAESEKGSVTKLYKAFKEALIHDLKPEDFADTFAQTITYGLFSAAVSRRYPEEGGSKSLTTETISEIVPETNPFLREVLATFLDVGGRKKGGIDFDELGIQDVVELLRSDETDMRAVLEDFGNRRQGEDPVIHFYEDYLKAYNKELKVKRGVFYTPQPVVSYIVRSVHELLQTEFGIEDGLASTITWDEMAARNPDIKIPEIRNLDGKVVGHTDPDTHFVKVLDPATGTATFLVEVIDVIHKHLQKKWKEDRDEAIALLRYPSPSSHSSYSFYPTFEAFWNAYVPDCLLPRLYGYELMMAPYAIAHMKVGLKLGETGYKFGSDKRVRIYLTNALEPPSELQARLALDWEALAHEAQAVKAVKETERFTVVIGNPPYSGISSNMTPEAQRIVDAYKFVDGAALDERKLWLQDDYVKFLRIAQTTVEGAGTGILGFITNHGYLDNPTFRGMRQSLLATFQAMQMIDLHGNANKKENPPDGSHDENVFDIRQGVAVCIAARTGSREIVAHTDLWGSRDMKYEWLATNSIGSTPLAQLAPDSPFYFLRPQNIDSRAEYNEGWDVADIMPVSCAGFVTARDHFVIDLDSEALLSRIADFSDPALSDEDIRSKYFEGMGSDKYPDGDSRGWKVPEARRRIQDDANWKDRLQRCLYRPFDFRPIYWTTWMVDWPRPQVMRHMLQGPNQALAVAKSVEIGRYEHALCTDRIIGHHSVSLKEVNYILPLFRYPTEQEAAMGIGKEPNLSPAYLDALAGAIGRRFESGGFPTGRDSEASGGHGGLFAAGAEPSTVFRESSAEPREPSAEARASLAEPREPSAELRASQAEARAPQAELRAPSAEPRASQAEASFSPEDVFHYIYAVLHSPAYRSRYAEFLKIDFPRIPLPGPGKHGASGPGVFDALVPLGADLVALHLMESPRLDQHLTTLVGTDHFLGTQEMVKHEPHHAGDLTDMTSGNGDHIGGATEMVDMGPRVEKVSYSNNTVWIDKAQTVGFQGVPEEVWNFHIGGYQVCEKWLKDRGPKKGKPGRLLSPEDITHYHRIVVALSETIRIMQEIDIAIDSHGGWPGAFMTGASDAAS